MRAPRRALFLALVLAPLAVLAQNARLLRIALLSDGDEAGSASLWRVFRARLKELGYAEGSHYAIEARWAGSDPQRLGALASEIAAAKPAVIVADGTPAALAARAATSRIPIVALRLADPVKAGLAASLARPGGNLTGTSVATAELAGKWAELLREVSPKTRSPAFLNDLEGRGREGVEKAFGAIAREGRDGLIVGAGAALFAQRKQVVEAAARQKIPAVYSRREYVEAGGLMSYGANLEAHYSHAADYVHRIARGASPGELPIEPPARLELVVNLRAANALGIKLPRALLLRADRIIP